MSRELIIKIHCDFCRSEVSEEDVISGDVTLNTRTYGLDLCASCGGGLLDKLQPKATALTEAKKQSMSKATPTSQKTLPCPACGHFVKNELGLKFHLKKMHP